MLTRSYKISEFIINSFNLLLALFANADRVVDIAVKVINKHEFLLTLSDVGGGRIPGTSLHIG